MWVIYCILYPPHFLRLFKGCGPTSLNAMVRKTIAAQINPSRIRRGDMRGMIALVSEEFEY